MSITEPATQLPCQSVTANRPFSNSPLCRRGHAYLLKAVPKRLRYAMLLGESDTGLYLYRDMRRAPRPMPDPPGLGSRCWG